MKEPSVLDYLKSKLNPFRPEEDNPAQLETPERAPGLVVVDAPPPGDQDAREITIKLRLPTGLPWRTLLAVFLALIGQFFMDPTGFTFGDDLGNSLRQSNFQSALNLGLFFYAIALALLLWAYFTREFSLPALPDEQPGTDPQTAGRNLIFIALLLSLAAFIFFVNNLFNPFNVTLWLFGLALFLRGIWLHRAQRPASVEEPQEIITPAPVSRSPGLIARWWDVALLLLLAWMGWGGLGDNIFLFGLVPLLVALSIIWLRDPDGEVTPAQKLKALFTRDPWHFDITRWSILLLAVIALVFFFRFYRLDGVPSEPFSDHAEKLLDVYDITQGDTHIFFERNTGREFIQFYWTALISYLLGTGLTFISLKIGTVLIGLFALPYVYLLGKELGGPRVALFALILVGVAYWPNTISRIGLRFPLYPAFTAPVLFYLVRGLRTHNRNDFILMGLFLGLGLHGYSSFRFVPFVVAATVGLYLLHRYAQGRRKQVLALFASAVVVSFLVFLPLFRFAIERPDLFSERVLTRVTDTERALPIPDWCGLPGNAGGTVCIFASNTFKAMMMFFWDNGSTWVHSVTGRPALDIAAGVLFAFGYILVFVRYLRERRWQDIFLLMAVPLLLMPSILSIAFPDENPSLNRTGGAFIVVFIIAAMALEGIYTSLRAGRSKGRLRRTVSVGAVLLLLAMSASQSYDLVFNKFDIQFQRSAWNTSDIGKIMRAFMAEGNSSDNAWVVPYPYWVDTRLSGIQAGLPTTDFAINRDDLPRTVSVQGAKLFIVKEEDVLTLRALHDLYPTGLLGKFDSPLEGKDFWIYTVPDSQMVIP